MEVIDEKRTYYLFDDAIFKYKEDIIDQELPLELGLLDDDISDWEPEGIEEISGLELLERMEEEDLWIQF